LYEMNDVVNVNIQIQCHDVALCTIPYLYPEREIKRY